MTKAMRIRIFSLTTQILFIISRTIPLIRRQLHVRRRKPVMCRYTMRAWRWIMTAAWRRALICIHRFLTRCMPMSDPTWLHVISMQSRSCCGIASQLWIWHLMCLRFRWLWFFLWADFWLQRPDTGKGRRQSPAMYLTGYHMIYSLQSRSDLLLVELICLRGIAIPHGMKSS